MKEKNSNMKKWLLVIVILAFCLIIILAVGRNSDNVQVETTISEYTPEEEISEEQNRMTVLTLYFIDSKTGELKPELRNIDVKEIMNEPYQKIMELLIEGSEKEEMQETIPPTTKINKISLEDENLVVDLSKDFIDKYEIGSEEQNKVIYSVVNTFLELKEISSVTFLIDGEKIEGMMDPYINIKS